MDFLKLEMCFHNSSGLDPSTKNILLRWNVVGMRYSVEGIQIIGGRVIKLIFS